MLSSAPTFATLFSGGEIGGIGIRAAGYRHLWGVEYDNDISDVARLNGFETITADVLTVDPRTLPTSDYLHASPVCTRASNANTSAELNDDGTKEAPLDIAMGEKTAQFIDVMRPRVFTLENVYGYRNFAAFRRITDALSRNGYMWDFDNLNSADFGVPQTRRRLILRAVRDALLPMLPAPVPWVGWYAAIEDLIPTLPESRFADWQLARLPSDLVDTVLVGANGTSMTIGNSHEPAPTIVQSKKTVTPRAFIVSNSKTEFGSGIRDAAEPVHAVTSQANGRTRAMLVNTREMHGNEGASYTAVSGITPAYSVAATSGPGRHKAFIVDGQSNDNGTSVTVPHGDTPSVVISASQNKRTLNAALKDGRVVSMTPRALARFQSIPDSYILPDKKQLACKIIGNGYPSLMAQRIAEGFYHAE